MLPLLRKLEPAIFLVPAIVALALLIFGSAPAKTVVMRRAAVLPDSAITGSWPGNYDQGDYLSAIAGNGVYRWAPSRMPLKVYISDGRNVPGYRPSLSSDMAAAFDEWCRASDGRLSWTRVASPNQADIVCRWESSPEGGSAYGVEAGVTKTIIEQNYRGQIAIQSATINILTGLFGRAFNDEEIHKTCLHEVGHALGLQGHSNSPGDIMFPTLTAAQVNYLRARDANTINKLYSDFTAHANAQEPIGESPSGASDNSGDGLIGSSEDVVAQSPQTLRDNSGAGYGGNFGYPSVRDQPDLQLPRGDFPGMPYRPRPPINQRPQRGFAYQPPYESPFEADSPYPFSGPGFAGNQPMPMPPGMNPYLQELAMRMAFERMRRFGYGR